MSAKRSNKGRERNRKMSVVFKASKFHATLWTSIDFPLSEATGAIVAKSCEVVGWLIYCDIM